MRQPGMDLAKAAAFQGRICLKRAAAGATCAAMVVLRPSLTRKLLGFGALFLGVIGLILPIMPGWPFLAVAVWLLRDQYVWAHRGVGVIRTRWPQMIPGIEAREEKALAWADRQLARARGVFRR